MEAMIYVGASKSTIAESRAAILDILEAPVGDAVKIRALKVFEHICAVNHVNINNVTLTNNEAPIREEEETPNE